MRIEAYGNPALTQMRAGGVAGANSASQSVHSPASASAFDEPQELSAQDKLRILLDEKRPLTQIAFDSIEGMTGLGQTIDLRV